MVYLIFFFGVLLIFAFLTRKHNERKRATMDKDAFILRHSKITVAAAGICGAFFMFGLFC